MSAASGIGLALARRFATEGMRVVLADIEEAPLDAAVEEFESAGVRVRTSIIGPWERRDKPAWRSGWKSRTSKE